MAARKLEVIIAGDAKGALKAFAETGAGAGRLGGKLAGLGKFAAAGLAVGAAAAVGTGIALFKIGESFDKSYDTIRVGTGATGKALQGLEGDFRNVVRDVPTSFANASQAIADLNTRTGQTGPGLRKLADQELELSRITKTDLGENIRTSTRLFGDWGIATGDQAKTLDKVFRASQATGIGVGDLMQQVVQFGTPLRQLGVGFDQALAMFSQFEKAGVVSETVLPGLKMALKNFAKEGKDPAKALAATFDSIKKAGGAAQANAIAFKVFGARAGPDLAGAIREGKFDVDALMKTISGGKDTILGAAADTESFGEKWTKLKNRVLVGLEPLARKVFDGMGKAMDRLGPIASKAWDAFQGGFQNPNAKIGPGIKGYERLMLELGQGFARVVSWVQTNWPKIQRVIGEVLDRVRAIAGAVIGYVQEHWPAIQQTVVEVFNEIRGVVGPALELVRAIVERVTQIIRGLWDRFGNHLLEHLRTKFNAMKQVVKGILEAVRGIIEIVTGIITLKWGKVWTGIKDLFGGVWNAIVGLAKDLLNTLSTVIGAGTAVISFIVAGAWGAIERGFSDAWGHIIDFAGTLATTIGNIMIDVANAILYPFRTAFNFIADAWNATVGSLSFHIPGWVPGLGGKGWSAPKIGHWNAFAQIGGGNAHASQSFTSGGVTRMAKGGVTDRPTLAIVGDAGPGNPEVTAPESLLHQIMSSELDAAARRHSGTPAAVLGYGGVTHYHYETKVIVQALDARGAGRQLAHVLHDYRRDNGGRLPWER